MRTVTLGAPRLQVTPLAYGIWPFGGGGPAGERAAIQATSRARSPGFSFSGTAQAHGPGHVKQTRAARC
jgi:aryl-alcohol dehydrogenase-like predicted oxidoreductase